MKEATITEEEIKREMAALQARLDELRSLLKAPSTYQGMQVFSKDGKTVVLKDEPRSR